jgi:hypothetical protein
VEYIFQPKTPQFFTKKKNFLNCKSDWKKFNRIKAEDNPIDN